MSRTAKAALAPALSILVAVSLVSCGGEDAQLLPGDTAREINANLDKVGELSDEGDCVGAESAAQQIGEQIEALSGVDEKLKRALMDGAERLNEVIAECEETIEETAPTTAPEESEAEPEKKPKKEKPKDKEKQKEKEAEGAPGGPETPSSTGELPPQANGEGKGVEGGGPPGTEGDEEIGPSGGVSPSNPVGEGD